MTRDLTIAEPEPADPPDSRPARLTRVAVMSDIHVSPEEGAELPYAWVEALAQRVRSAHPDVSLIAGDLFDRRDASAEALLVGQRFIELLAEGGRPVALIGGNHDAETPLAGLLRLPESVHWFGALEASTHMLPELGLAIHGQSVKSARDARNVVPGYPAPVPGVTNIALLHTSVSGLKSKRVCHPTTLDELRGDTRYDAWVLGHVHERMLLCGSPLVFFPGGSHPRHVADLLGPGTPAAPAPGVLTPGAGSHADAASQADAGFIMLEVGAATRAGFTQGAAGAPWRLGLPAPGHP